MEVLSSGRHAPPATASPASRVAPGKERRGKTQRHRATPPKKSATRLSDEAPSNAVAPCVMFSALFLNLSKGVFVGPSPPPSPPPPPDGQTDGRTDGPTDGLTDQRTQDFFGHHSEEALLVTQGTPSPNVTKLGYL